MMGYLIGYDIGSSSVKASLIDAANGKLLAAATSPDSELPISSPKPGWAEQDPEIWWEHLKNATAKLKAGSGVALHQVQAIGISYQMHGLVLVDQNQKVLRPAIIWCDSRAVEIGEQAFTTIGSEICLKHLLNSPGNFTASKLRWVQLNEPEIYAKIFKAMLPGDFIAMKLTGEITTTASGLSEGIFWDYQTNTPAKLLLDYYQINPELLPSLVGTFASQGTLSATSASELGLAPNTPVTYRAGDQPNNAFSLNVLNPGEIAATAGTSGVIYGVGDQPNYDAKSRVNTFVHVNHTLQAARYGTLLCVNGTGILNRWLKQNFTPHLSYAQMNELAATVPPGAAELAFIPYGNGAERTWENKQLKAHLKGLELNIHQPAHILRASQEGIVFALNYGLEVMKTMGIKISTIKAGSANMFLSPLFKEIFAAVTGASIELYNTDGSQGAARGAGIGAGIYHNTKEAFQHLQSIEIIEPNQKLIPLYQEIYQKWLSEVNKEL